MRLKDLVFEPGKAFSAGMWICPRCNKEFADAIPHKCISILHDELNQTKMTKYVQKRIKIPSLNLDFYLMAKEKDAKRLDTYLNFMMSIWKQLGKGNEIKVFDEISQLNG